MDGNCHTEWNKPDKDKYHMISLLDELKKKGYKWTYLQNRNWLTKKTIYGKQSMVTKGEGGGGILRVLD